MTDGGFAKNRPWRRTYVWVGVAAALAIAVIGATVWTVLINHRGGPRDDCSVVEGLGPKWDKMQQVEKDTERGPGETKDLLALASAESDMGDQIRAAQATVSNPALKTQLGDWAQGMAITAKGQRDAANPSANPVPGQPTPGADSADVRAAMLIHDSTAALQKSCPQLQLSPAPQS